MPSGFHYRIILFFILMAGKVVSVNETNRYKNNSNNSQEVKGEKHRNQMGKHNIVKPNDKDRVKENINYQYDLGNVSTGKMGKNNALEMQNRSYNLKYSGLTTSRKGKITNAYDYKHAMGNRSLYKINENPEKTAQKEINKDHDFLDDPRNKAGSGAKSQIVMKRKFSQKMIPFMFSTKIDKQTTDPKINNPSIHREGIADKVNMGQVIESKKDKVRVLVIIEVVSCKECKEQPGVTSMLSRNA